MRPDWRTFLGDSGAVISDDRVIHVGAADMLCDLSHQGLIAVRGEDALNFLQGQFSNDLCEVNAERSQLSAYCTPKGRMLACLRLFRRDDAYCLRMPAELIESVVKRLRLYVLRAKVTLEDESDALVRIGLAGANTEALLHDAIGVCPEQIDAAIQAGTITALRLPGIAPRFELQGEFQDMCALWRTLSARAQPVGEESWRLADILAGIPNVYNATSEIFIPQMLNLQHINGVSFTKGCYTGQEIVARTQHLGRLKRRMYLACIDGEHPPRPGDELYRPTEGGQNIGRIVDAARHPDGGFAVLAVIIIEHAEGAVALGSADGPLLAIESLPYSLDQP